MDIVLYMYCSVRTVHCTADTVQYTTVRTVHIVQCTLYRFSFLPLCYGHRHRLLNKIWYFILFHLAVHGLLLVLYNV